VSDVVIHQIRGRRDADAAPLKEAPDLSIRVSTPVPRSTMHSPRTCRAGAKIVSMKAHHLRPAAARNDDRPFNIVFPQSVSRIPSPLPTSRLTSIHNSPQCRLPIDENPSSRQFFVPHILSCLRMYTIRIPRETFAQFHAIRLPCSPAQIDPNPFRPRIG